jgi:hypothetical protein
MEALGDNFMERKQVKAAIEAYKKAFKLAPKNVAVEEKLASAALSGAMFGSVEEQLRMGLKDSPFLTGQDIVARRPYAILLTAIFPGAGHVALGRTTAGIAIMATWMLSGIWLLIMHKDVERLVKMTKIQGEHPNMVVVIPLGIMALLFSGSLLSLKSNGPPTARKGAVARPRPPVDLPFD